MSNIIEAFSSDRNFKFSRTWAMPNHETFAIPPIKSFVEKYVKQSKISVDSFARNTTFATYRNDMDTSTLATFHLEAECFHNFLREQKIKADLWIFDPPYSPRQIKEHYTKINVPITIKDTQIAARKKAWKESILPVLTDDAIVLSFGWDSIGMGKKLGFDIIEILLVCHGGGHYDTICTAEKRTKIITV